MTYNPKDLQAQLTPKSGDRVKATVTHIEKAHLADFVKPEIIASWEGASAEDPAIEVTVDTADGYQKRRVLKYPENNMVSPRSNLAKWKKVYGSYPTEGQVIELVADEEGYYQFLF